MKSFLFGTAALTTLCLSLPALAADLPARVTKAPPVLVSPAYDWSGFYLGVHAGYTFGEDDTISTTGQAQVNINNVAGGARPGQVRLDRDGFIGGGQAGYNWQLTPNWVMGLETDISYVDIRNDTNVVTIPLNGIGTLNNTFRTRMEYFGTVRGRIGYAWDRTLVYARVVSPTRISRTASRSSVPPDSSSSQATIAAPRLVTPSAPASSTHSVQTGA